MEYAPFASTHIDCFLRSAQAEGWITDQREIEFLLGSYPQGCLTALVEGRPTAFITAIRYERSAWIGNLLVLPDFRRRGLGRRLMEKVLHCLDSSGCETVWLTASAAGAHLYRTLGFAEIDRVERWRGAGVAAFPNGPPGYATTAASVDCLGWGDNRRAIFEGLPENSSCFMLKDGFLLYSPCGADRQIGPFGALSGDAAALLLDTLLENESSGDEVFLDVPVNNRLAGALLSARGFSIAGSTLLMSRGAVPAYHPEYIYSLASPGSYG